MKYQHLRTLQEKHILTPQSFLYDGDLDALKWWKTPSVIVRSSYRFEDGDNRSYAGFFQSIGPIDRHDAKFITKAIETIKEDAKSKLTSIGQSYEDFDVFVQEYQEIDGGGVIFLQDNKMLLHYSHGWNGAKNIVNGTQPDTTIYTQWSFELINDENEYLKQYRKNIHKTLKKIQRIFTGNLDIEFGISEWNIFIFQVRPLTANPFTNHGILDSSNIGENFPGTVSRLTASFVTHLYSQVYQSLAHHSGISLSTIARCNHIFQDLIVYKDGKLFYNITNWYKMLLLFPGDHKKSFDTMIGSSWKVDYIILDDVIDLLPGFCFRIKYFFLVLWKMVTFRRKLKKLENYLEDFYVKFEKMNLETTTLGEVYFFYKQFESRLNASWHLTIENDFVIMKMWKNIDLRAINGLISANQIESLSRVAYGKMTIQEYKKIYGARLGDELKLENIQADDDSVLMDIIAKYRENPPYERDQKIRETTISGFLSAFIKNREQFRLYRAKNFHITRLLFVSIGRKLIELWSISKEEDIFDLSLQDVGRLVLSHQPLLQENGDKILIGKAFSGRAYVMKSFSREALEYDVIVAENFDPGWTSLLGNLKGILIERGNLLSHVSIMCRELNIPLLIGAKESTLYIQTGDHISVNSQGDVTKL